MLHQFRFLDTAYLPVTFETDAADDDNSFLKCAGTDGREIVLRTNVFPVKMFQQYCLYQYHVDFNPPVPSAAIRKSMIAEHREMFGNFYMFDGMQLFLQLRLENDVS